jgi:hypothetical protein
MRVNYKVRRMVSRSNLDAQIDAARATYDYLLVFLHVVPVDSTIDYVQQWLTNYGEAAVDDPSEETLLTEFSRFSSEHKFHDVEWILILTSPLLIFLAQNSTVDSQTVPPRLLCLSSVLAHASTEQLRAIREVYDAEAFLDPILECAPIIPGHLKLPYLLVLARVVRIYDANFADAFQALTGFLDFQANSPAKEGQIEALGSVIVDYINENRHMAFVEDGRVRDLLGQFMQWAFPPSGSPLLELSLDALLKMLEAVNVITKHFPGSCIDFCMAPWQEIDEWLRESGEMYPKFHKLFMSSLLNMARWRPRLVTWTFESLTYFADCTNPDVGIPGLEIMAILFRDDWDLDEEFRTLEVCDWLLSELGDSAYQRRVAIMRCFCAFLARVHPDVAGYDVFFANLAQFLDDFMSCPEFGELLYLSLFILLWFVRHGWCSPEQLRLFDSLAAVESAVADRLSVLGYETGDEEIMGLWDQINFLWTWCKSDESEHAATFDDQWTPEPDAVEPTESPLADLLRQMKAGRKKVDRTTESSFSAIHRRPFYRDPGPSIADTAEYD